MVTKMQMFKASGPSKHLHEWQKIGAPHEILDWLSSGVQLPFTERPESFHLPNFKLSFSHGAFVAEELSRLIQSGAVVQCDSNFPPKCISPIHCVPKKGGKLRLIIDLRRINQHLDVPKFCYEDIRVVSQLVHSNDYMVTLDLKNGFHHIPIHKADQEYLGFAFRGKLYKWTVLPFGLKISPYVFCKTIRAVIAYVRTENLRVVAYMDDFWLAATKSEIENHKNILLSTLHNLGLIVNMDKSSLTPSMSQEFIGYKVCTENKPILKIPNARISKLRKTITRVLKLSKVKARVLARIAGQCVSMSKAILPGKLLLRNVYRLLASKISWEQELLINAATRNDLEWWKNAVQSWNGNPIVLGPVDVTMETDASQTGWGAICEGQEAAGFWNRRVAMMPSNYREMMAILLAIKSFKNLENKTVRVYTDNITAAAYVNHLGGSSVDLCQVANAIWLEAISKNITLQARYLPGVENGTADYLSRLPNKYEWKLHPNLFSYINKIWGPHSIDRFATLANTQLPVFNSRYAEPLTAGIDALVQKNWHHHNNYCNPPFRLIPQLLEIIESKDVWATIIAPYWKAQPWFQKLTQMSVCPPLKLPKRAFLPSGVQPEPWTNPIWDIYAWRICGLMSRD